MGTSKNKSAKYVYVKPTNTIGIIIDSGSDKKWGDWFRTDCDGTRDSSELIFLHTKKHIKEFIKKYDAFIHPSTAKEIGI